MSFTQNKANNFSAIATFLNKSKDFKGLEYNIVEYSMPDRTLNATRLSSSSLSGNIPGDRLEYSQNQVLRFIVDENLEVYFALCEMQDKALNTGISDELLTLNIMNNVREVIAIGKYTNVWISNISGLGYSTTQKETTVFVDVSINFRNFKLEKVR